MTKSTRGTKGNSGFQSNSKSPSVESVNKWKIPHYYRRSPSSASQNSNSLDPNVSSTPSTPNINVMSSPKKVLIEDRKKIDVNGNNTMSSYSVGNGNKLKKSSGSRSKRNGKKNPGEMVFVNYTVQDGGSGDIDNSLPNELPQPPPKKKSSKNRMLKIFGNSKNESPDSSPSQPVKRSYSTLLNYAPSLPQGNTLPLHSVTGTSNNSSNKTSGINGTLDDSDDEVVPTSQPPAQMDPSSLGLFQPFMTNSASPTAMVDYNNEQDAVAQFNNNDENIVNKNNEGHNSKHSDNSEQFVIPDPTVLGTKTTDENDASIAFSKMFSRKRANTGGSMSSLTSLNTSSQQPLQQQFLQSQSHPQLSHSQSYSSLGNRNLSFSSISSYNNKFSPARTASPARPRSARGSLGLRLPRDTNSFQDLPESISPGVVAQEVFLDSQSTIKGKAANGKYKRKQDSMPDIHRVYTPSTATSNTSATPSSSLVTPPAFPAGYTAASSASSTPNALELSQINNSASNSTVNNTNNSVTNLDGYGSQNASSMFYRDNSAEILLGDSDVPTPIENFPALKGIPRTTLEEKEEDEEEDENVANDIHNMAVCHDRMRVPPTNEHLDYTQIAQGSSAGSSQVDSIMTTSLSATTTNSVLSNHAFQDHASPMSNTKDLKFDHQGKLTGRSVSNVGILPRAKADLSNRSTRGNINNGNIPNGPFPKLSTEFDFENPNTFLRDSQIHPTFNQTVHKNYPSNVFGNEHINGVNFESAGKRLDNDQKFKSTNIADMTSKFVPESFANFSTEDIEAPIGIPHDFFDRPSENNHTNGTSKNSSNFPFYGTEINDFSYL